MFYWSLYDPMFTFINIKNLMNKLKNDKICEKAPLRLTDRTLFRISYDVVLLAVTSVDQATGWWGGCLHADTITFSEYFSEHDRV